MRHLRWILIPALIALAIWRLAPHLSDFSQLFKLTASVNYLWVVVAILSQTGQYIGDGALSKILLKMIGFKISFSNTLKIASLNVFAAHLFPVGEAGALATVFYFYRKLGVSPEGIIFLSISWSLITGIVLALLFTSSIFFLPDLLLPIHPSQGTKLFALMLVLFALIILLKIDWAYRVIKKFLLKFAWSVHLKKFKHNIGYYLNLINNHPKEITKASIAAFIYYVTNILTLIASFLAFGTTPNLAIVIFAYSLSLFSGWITLAPAGFGATEASLVLIFLHYKLDPATTLAAVLLFRIISFWIPIPAGAISYYLLKKETNPNSASSPA